MGKKEFPLTLLKVAEVVLRAVNSAGGRITPEALSSELNIRGGGLSRKIASTKRWGLIKGSGILTITENGQRILHPLSEKEIKEARNDAFLGIDLFNKLYHRFKDKLPNDNTFISTLIREYSIQDRDARTILNIYKDAIKNFLIIEENNSKVSLSSSENGKDIRKIRQTDNSGVSIIIEAPSGKFDLFAKNKEEFEDLIKNKLAKVWDAIRVLWTDVAKETLQESNANKKTEEISEKTFEE